MNPVRAKYLNVTTVSRCLSISYLKYLQTKHQQGRLIVCSVSSEILNAKGSPNVSGKIISVLATAWKLSKYGVITGPYFPAFGQNTKRYFVSLRIQSECGKIWTRSNFEFGHFSGSEHLTQFEYWILCESPFTRTWKWNWKGYIQKQPSRGVLRKRCSENMQQIYRRTPMPKCDFNKVALATLLKSQFRMGVLL